MSIDEIVHTCSNENVARAAVASIGVSFASRVKFAADMLGVSVGGFTARTVRTFGAEASAGARSEVVRAMVRSDQPILRGLEAILERHLEDSSLLDRGGWQPIRSSLTSRPDVARDCCYP
ncbi:MAG: hypothetical protein ACLQL2_01260 [Methylovirgula sp.]